MSEYLVEKGVPIPLTKHGKIQGHRTKDYDYPWAKLEVGDSFFVSYGPGASHPTNMYKLAMGAGITITTRRNSHGYRVWRIA